MTIEPHNINSFELQSLDTDANAYLVYVGPHQVLLDAGRLSASSASWWSALPRQPDAVWLSHSHGDHVDAWGDVLRCFGAAVPTWSTAQTRQWMSDVVDSTIADAYLLREWIRVWSPATPSEWLTGGCSIEATHLSCGHIPGASALSLDMAAGEKFHRLLYLSDFCLHDQPLTPGARLEDWPKPDTLIMETVLSNHDDITPDAIAAGWAQIRVWLTEQPRLRKGQLWPVAHFGEAQEVLACAISCGVRPVVHQRVRTDVDGLTPGGWDVADTGQCVDALRAGRVVIVPGAHLGDGTVGRVMIWRALAMSNTLVVLMNQLRGGSLAAHIWAQRHKSEILWRAQRYARQATIEHVQVSNHAPRADLLKAVEVLSPKTVVLVHGPRRGMGQIRRLLRTQGYEGKIIRLGSASDAVKITF